MCMPPLRCNIRPRAYQRVAAVRPTIKMWPRLNSKQAFAVGGLVIVALIAGWTIVFVTRRIDAHMKRSTIGFRVPAGAEGFFLVPRSQNENCAGPMVVTVPPTGRCAPVPECAGPIVECYDSSGHRIPTWFEDEEFRGYDWENRVGLRPVNMDNDFTLGDVFYVGSERGFRRNFPGWDREIIFGLDSKSGDRAIQP